MSHGRLSDDRLARAAAHGEPDAFAEVYARYNGALYSYCLSILHDPDDARDALQATMEKAFGAIAEQRVAGGLRAWLFGIAHNEAISLTRTRPATQPYPAEALAASAGDPAQREQLDQLMADLRTLPERQRSALVLRELSGLGSSEIGSALGISPAAAKQSVYEARAALLAQSGGRDMDCRQAQTKLSESDGRVRRGRRLKAHLADCALCTAFAAAIPGRSAGMRALFPPLGAAVAAKTLAAATATSGAGHGAAVAGKAGGSSHVAAVTATIAVVAAGALGALALNQSDSDPTEPPAAKAATPPSAPKAKQAAAPPARPAAGPPPAAVTGYSDLDAGVLGALEGSATRPASGGAGNAAGARDGGGSLPFTGLDLMLMALAGAALVGTGLGLRRVAQAPRL